MSNSILNPFISIVVTVGLIAAEILLEIGEDDIPS